MPIVLLERLFQVAGLLHVGLLVAGATMTRVVHFREHTAVLPPFLCQLFRVYIVFIGLMLAGFGLLTFWFAEVFAAGDPLARGVCVFMAVFWALRLLVATFVFDVSPYITNGWYRVGYWATNAVFVYFLALYGFMACGGAAS